MDKKESASEARKNKKVKDLLSELASGDEKKQIKAVQSLKVHGNDSVIEPLLIVLSKNPEGQLAGEISDLLNTTKSTKVPPVIANALVDERFEGIRHTLLTSIWNSGLDYRPYLKEIVTAGTKGEMMEALECITIVENIDGQLSEDELFEPILVLTEYIGSNRSETGAKMDMLKEILMTLQNMNNQL